MAETELHRLIDAEASADAARAELSRRELARYRGVCWSGTATEAPAVSSPATIQARAEARLAVRQDWRNGADGRFIAAIADCQAAARAAFTTGERARAGAARGEAADWRLRMLDELTSQARALAAGVRQARRSMSL
ncbi:MULTISPECIES: hypothetical protein [unclassified Phenylobacterium]|uniref:hypothetical protein n=1 Tax=unclassified Phenylobacterium TaxID=2640670 RepID=UPI0007016C4F|nr:MULTISPECIES: hypothetical protein [unclassified Phenylobacterium]KQW66394.1 hypothetical protein ASC73_18590 [Phenylobacterium sp. Root1277]